MAYMKADEIFGERVHIIMRRDRMPQSALAVHLNIDQAALSKKLRGERSWTLDELLTVARVLNVPITDLLPGDDYQPVLAGRGRAVRPKGFEPPTFCSVASAEGWGYESLTPGSLSNLSNSVASSALWLLLAALRTHESEAV